MELQDILAEIGDEKAAIVKAAIESEKNRGIEASRKKGSENTKLLSEVAKIKDALRDTLGVDDIPGDADLKEFLASQLKTKTGSVEDRSMREIEKLKKYIAEKEANELKLQKEIESKTIHSTLSTKMHDQFHGHDLIIKDLISSGRVKTVNNDVIFLDGDLEIDVEKGIESLKISRPDLVKNNQIAGGGSAAGKKTANNKTMSHDAFNALPGKERAAFMAQGGKLI